MNGLAYIALLSILGIIAYTYILYPVILWMWRTVYSRPCRSDNGSLPSVTVIISMFNEKAWVNKRIQNLLEQDYPEELLTIAVGSDASTDGTNEILREWNHTRVQQHVFTERRGKASVLNDLLREAKSEIIVLTDANTMYDGSCIRNLVSPFSDPSIGGVCGALKIVPEHGSSGGFAEYLYWRFESFIKASEGLVGSTLGATGAVYAVRRTIARALPTTVIVMDDLMQSLNVIEQGYRFVYQPDAVAFEAPANSIGGEFRRRVRIGAGNIGALRPYVRLLLPVHGQAAFSLWSHKIFRWTIPFLVPVAIVAGVMMQRPEPLLSIAVWSIAIGSIWVVCGMIVEAMNIHIPFLGFAYYALAMNVGLGIGLVRGLFGSMQPAWSRVGRSGQAGDGRPT